MLALFLASRKSDAAPHHIAADVAALSRLSARATTAATRYCNGHLESDAYDKTASRIKTAADKTLAPYGLTSRTTGDPRGYCLRLLPAPGAAPVRGNTWGGDADGYGV